MHLNLVYLITFVEQLTSKFQIYILHLLSTYRYAGLQNAEHCFCGTSFGRYGPGKCTKKCRLTADEDSLLSICGGEASNTVYSTGVKVPGPPSSLHLNSSTENSLSISWTPFSSRPSKFVIAYHIYVALNKSFDNSVRLKVLSTMVDACSRHYVT